MSYRHFSFSGDDPRECFQACLRLSLRGMGEPTVVKIDDAQMTNAAEALELLASGAMGRIDFTWERWEQDELHYDYLLIDTDDLVKVGQEPCLVNARETLELLRQLPFKLAAGGCLEGKWWPDYVGPHFTGHYPFGWMCAFKGEGGHRWLVSRRFLDYGPWRLIRDAASDLSMVQFHDLEADEETAFAQAIAGHRHLMDNHAGGVISEGTAVLHLDGPLPLQSATHPSHLNVTGMTARSEFIPFQYTAFRPNFYDRASKTSIVLVQEREVSLLEMMEACAARLWQPYEGITVEQVAFVFFDPAQARRQLFELWVRGLEVRAIEAGGERRLDDSFEPPPPQVPGWVQRVREREGF